MRHRSVQSRATSLTAAAVLAVAGLGSAAQAGFVLDLRLTGGGKTTTVTANPSSATTVSLDLWGQVTGGSAQSLQDAFFGISASGAAGSLGQVSFSGPFAGVATDVTPSVTTSYGGTVSSTGVGLGTDGASANWVFARSTSMVTTSTPGVTSAAISGGTEFLLGTVTFTIPTSTTSGTATLHVVPRTNAGSSLIVPALWQEDTTVKDASVAGDYTAGLDVTITIQGAVANHINGNTSFNNYDSGNEVIDLNDLAAVLNNFGTTNSAGYAWPRVAGSGPVDLNDLALVLNNFGTHSPDPSGVALAASAVSVPEPASLGLLGLGAAASVRRRRR